MIIEPGFLDHWKTQALIKATDDPASPLMLIRLWEYCQQRKTSRFRKLSDQALSAICRWNGPENQLRRILTDTGWILTDNEVLIVHDWESSNRLLVSAWKNGNKGGRPRVTDRKPTGNRAVNRQVTDPSIYLSSLSVPVQNRFKEWITVRKAMGKAPKNWDKMFSEQVKWLGQFNEEGQLESISASIRGNWQGLFAPKLDKPTKQLTPEESSDGYWVKPTWKTK